MASSPRHLHLIQLRCHLLPSSGGETQISTFGLCCFPHHTQLQAVSKFCTLPPQYASCLPSSFQSLWAHSLLPLGCLQQPLHWFLHSRSCFTQILSHTPFICANQTRSLLGLKPCNVFSFFQNKSQTREALQALASALFSWWQRGQGADGGPRVKLGTFSPSLSLQDHRTLAVFFRQRSQTHRMVLSTQPLGFKF